MVTGGGFVPAPTSAPTSAPALYARVGRAVGRWWCRVGHRRVIGPRWGAVARCGECGREWVTPWAPGGGGDGNNGANAHTHNHRAQTPPGPAPLGGIKGLGVVMAVGAAAGVMVAGAVLGAVVGAIWGRGWLGWWGRESKQPEQKTKWEQLP